MNNRQLLQRSLAAVWHPCTQMKVHESLPLVPIERGEGAWLFDFDGGRYLDGISSWWVNLFGHGNPRINLAIREQLNRLEHVMLAGFTHEPVVQLSEKLAALTGHTLGHCFYASDGASATEIALKMSVHYWRNLEQTEKNEFICLANSYHGETAGALAVTDIALFRSAYAPLIRPAATLATPDARLAKPGETAKDFALRCAAALEAYLALHHQRTAAFIVEPLVQCAAGMAMYDAEYLRAARDICSRYEVLLIADEIAVGFGRTGTFFACEQAGITPDLLCLSKGLSAGYLPLSVTLCNDAIYQAFYSHETGRGFLHSHSYTGNPLACAAALASLAIFESDNVIVANCAKAAALTLAAKALAQHPRASNFRHCGMIWAFDVSSEDPLFARKFFAAALQRQLLLRPIGNTVYFMPPYVIGDEEIALLVSGTLAALEATP